MTLKLVPHPETPPKAVRGVTAVLDAEGITYRVEGAEALKVPARERPRRTDGLWETTCFELFLRPAGGDAYVEFNFSPSTQWAAYAFDGYRKGSRNLPLSAAPVIARDGDGWRVTLRLADIEAGPQVASVTAVIEETDGTKSYWALAHAGAKPDFHLPDSFVLPVPGVAA